jgi:hypothetical protein
MSSTIVLVQSTVFQHNFYVFKDCVRRDAMNGSLYVACIYWNDLNNTDVDEPEASRCSMSSDTDYCG